jgi:hypothetical protein
MVNIPTEAVRFDMYYMGTSPVPEGDEKVKTEKEPVKAYEVNEGTPQFKNFYIRNIQCNGAAQAIYLQGVPEMKINNIFIENSSFKTTTGFTCIDGENIRLTNVKMEVSKGEPTIIINSKNVEIK